MPSSMPEILRTCPTCGQDIPLEQMCSDCESDEEVTGDAAREKQQRIESAKMLAQAEQYKFDVENSSRTKLFFQTFSWREILFLVGALFWIYYVLDDYSFF